MRASTFNLTSPFFQDICSLHRGCTENSTSTKIALGSFQVTITVFSPIQSLHIPLTSTLHGADMYHPEESSRKVACQRWYIGNFSKQKNNKYDRCHE